MANNIYENATYLQSNPSWHEEDSPWKQDQIMQLLNKHQLPIKSVAEIGCGVGEILNQLWHKMPGDVEFSGYDIAAEAIARAKKKERERLHYYEQNVFDTDKTFDLLMAIDVVEHIPDYYQFLKGCKQHATYKLYHFPLELNVLSVMRASFAFPLASGKNEVGHLHFFTAESALMALIETEHRIIDTAYTAGGVALAKFHPSLKRTIANAARYMISQFSDAWASRLLGGYSLLVLTV